AETKTKNAIPAALLRQNKSSSLKQVSTEQGPAAPTASKKKPEKSLRSGVLVVNVRLVPGRQLHLEVFPVRTFGRPHLSALGLPAWIALPTEPRWFFPRRSNLFWDIKLPIWESGENDYICRTRRNVRLRHRHRPGISESDGGPRKAQQG
ncbi:hypothetical protein B0H16DRAFT_1617023, partial [Mycena metata]